MGGGGKTTKDAPVKLEPHSQHEMLAQMLLSRHPIQGVGLKDILPSLPKQLQRREPIRNAGSQRRDQGWGQKKKPIQ